jgi:hypothetical protein
MLKLWMYQAARFFSQSGRCWMIGISATCSGGSSRAAGIRKTIVVWYDVFLPVRTRKSWATPAAAPRIRKVIQPSASPSSLGRNGPATAAAITATATR